MGTGEAMLPTHYDGATYSQTLTITFDTEKHQLDSTTFILLIQSLNDIFSSLDHHVKNAISTQIDIQECGPGSYKIALLISITFTAVVNINSLSSPGSLLDIISQRETGKPLAEHINNALDEVEQKSIIANLYMKCAHHLIQTPNDKLIHTLGDSFNDSKKVLQTKKKMFDACIENKEIQAVQFSLQGTDSISIPKSEFQKISEQTATSKPKGDGFF